MMRSVLFLAFSLAAGLAISNLEALADNAFRIGTVHSLSGFGSSAGAGELNGIRLAVEEINAAGGIGGDRLEIVVEDNASNASRTASAVEKLMKVDKVSAVLGPNWMEWSDIAAPLANANHVPVIVASGTTNEDRADRRFVFSTVPKHAVQVRPLVQEMLKRHASKVVLIKSNSPYLEAMIRAIEASLREAGVARLEILTFNSGERDFRATISRLRQQGVDTIVPFLLEGGDLHAFLKQRKELKLGGLIYTLDITFDESIMNDLPVAEGAFFMNYVMHAPASFHERYRKRFGVEPVFSSPRSYDSVFIVKNAIQRCGADPEAVTKCIKETDHSGVSGRIAFDPQGLMIDAGDISAVKRVANGRIAESQ